MTAIERLMREWLASDEPAKRLHAEARLKLPFAAAEETDDETTPTRTPGSAPAPRVVRRISPAMRDRINTCLYRECRTGCQRSLCHAGRGDYWHQVSLADCAECLSPLTPATSPG